MNNAINYLNGLDILVNNAGTMVGRYQLETISEKDFLKIFDLNAKSAYFAIKSACTIFKEQNYGNISSAYTVGLCCACLFLDRTIYGSSFVSHDVGVFIHLMCRTSKKMSQMRECQITLGPMA